MAGAKNQGRATAPQLVGGMIWHKKGMKALRIFTVTLAYHPCSQLKWKLQMISIIHLQ